MRTSNSDYYADRISKFNCEDRIFYDLQKKKQFRADCLGVWR